jgi:hypothetical protein
MLLAADRSQDIYETASAWTEEAMAGAGFSGPWAELRRCYRIPGRLIPYVDRFAADFMSNSTVDVPTAMLDHRQLGLDEAATALRWVQVSDPQALVTAAAEEVPQMMKRLTQTTAVADVVVLAPTRQLGADLSAQIAQRFAIRVHHTFDADDRVARKLKLSFFKGDARVKATTLHSFKGWESRHLVVLVDSIQRPGSAALLYTAMTRLRWDLAGSCLTVVSSCPELRAFGGTWPEYVGSTA